MPGSIRASTWGPEGMWASLRRFTASGMPLVGLILLLGLIGSAIPFALFYIALGRGEAGKVSAWFFLVPVIGVLTAWPLLGETPSTVTLIGVAIITVVNVTIGIVHFSRTRDSIAYWV